MTSSITFTVVSSENAALGLLLKEKSMVVTWFDSYNIGISNYCVFYIFYLRLNTENVAAR